MNKKILSSLLIFVFTAIIVVNAEAIVNFVSELIVPKEKIVHTAVTNVSSVDRNLNVKATVEFGVYVSAPKAEMIYYFDNDSSKSKTVSKKNVTNGKPFYLETGRFESGHSSISYQLRARLVGKNGDETYAYWPEDGSSFQTITIANSTSTVVGHDGGTVEIDDGNQETGDGGVTVQPGTLDPGTEVIIEEIDFSNWFPTISFNRSDSSASFYGTPIYGLNIETNPPQETFNPPMEVKLKMQDSDATKFVVVYRRDASVAEDDWETVKIDKVDFKERLVYCKGAKAGQYILFPGKDLGDRDYRPAKRARVKSRIGTYGGFEFNNLKDGDVVKIYTTNGKKIAELTSGNYKGFEWKGREGTNNSGDWAKSGIYIYQIKLKEKSKILSGTIVLAY